MFSSSISPSQSSPCFIPQTFSFGFNHDTYYHDFLLHHYNNLTTTTPLIPPTLTNQETPLPNDQYGLNNVVRSKKQTTKRKDRHCKIVTAQGLRDRRVRLSTGIAREFFDLQDLLGFDKASKTLDWLLTKSRTAINDLVQMNQINVIDDDDESHLNNNNTTFCTSVQVFENSAKELRAKARARARQRTLEKYCIKKLTTTTTQDADEVMKKPSQLGSCSTCESELFCFCQLNG